MTMRRAAPRRQQGYALIVLTAILVMGGSWLIVRALTSDNRAAAERARNAEVLALAKNALIGYVAQRAIDSAENNPGRLPCPEAAGYFGDIAQEGTAAGSCSLPAIGRFPWKTVGLEKLLDGNGEPLWYVVSPGWASSGGALIINSNTAGQLTVDGQANAAVALLIAPGSPLAVQSLANCTARNQVRLTSSGGTPVPPDYRDYLECENATYPASGSFITRRPAAATYSEVTFGKTFNDQVLSLTTAELLPAVEAAVSARIKRDVIPQFQSAYASSTWGTGVSLSSPIYPFAVPFANPSTSTFKGVAGTTQGLMPLNSSSCSTLTSGRCDTAFTASWDTAAITMTQTGGTATSMTSSCASSTSTQATCVITAFSRSSCFLCSINVTVSMRAKAPNVGLTFRTFSSAGASGLTTLTSPLQTDGSAIATYTGTLNGGSGGLCGTLIGVSCSCTTCPITVTVPITVYGEHPFLNPSASASWYWFFANNWHQLTYYAVAASHVPNGGTHVDCVTAGNCLTVTSGSSSSNSRATLVLMGRSLNGTARPSASYGNYLESTATNDWSTGTDRDFKQDKISKSFNDRFVSIY